jgi:hypothetical protein
MVEDYDSARVAASSDVEPWQRRHPHLPMFSAYARNVLANLRQACSNDHRSHCEQRRSFSYARSQPEAGHRQGNACQTLVAGKIVSAGVVAPTPTLTRPSTRQGCVMSLVGTYWRRCLGERPLRARRGRLPRVPLLDKKIKSHAGITPQPLETVPRDPPEIPYRGAFGAPISTIRALCWRRASHRKDRCADRAKAD